MRVALCLSGRSVAAEDLRANLGVFLSPGPVQQQQLRRWCVFWSILCAWQ